MTGYKDRLIKLESANESNAKILKSILSSSRVRDSVTGGFTAKKIDEYIEQCILSNKTFYAYGIHVSIDPDVFNDTGKVQAQHMKRTVARYLTKRLNEEADTVAGNMLLDNSESDIIIAAVSPVKATDYIRTIIDDAYMWPEYVYSTETIIHYDDSSSTVLARLTSGLSLVIAHASTSIVHSKLTRIQYEKRKTTT